MTDIPITFENSPTLHEQYQRDLSSEHSSIAKHKANQQPHPFPQIDPRRNGILRLKNSTLHLKNGNLPHSVQRNESPTSTDSAAATARRRSNSKSQVVNIPSKPKTTASTASSSSSSSSSPSSSSLSVSSGAEVGTANASSSRVATSSPLSYIQPKKRNQVQYYVTLLPLNDTFTKKHLPVATYPETTKLGRPTGTKYKPEVTNGYFDSRVLSRNHAQIYIDLTNGKMMLQDLGSSNGTYLNDVRLNKEPTEVKVGDIVCLGFNVQAESTHKQISLKVENLSLVTNTPSSLAMRALGIANTQFDTPEFKHLAFVEEIYRKINAEVDIKSGTKKNDGNGNGNGNKEEWNNEHGNFNSATRNRHDKVRNIDKRLSFDSAMFGDVNSELEDDLLGLFSTENSGIYNNSQVTNTSTLENVITLLALSSTQVKQQTSALDSIQSFLTNYKRDLDSLNKKHLEEQLNIKWRVFEGQLQEERTRNEELKAQLARVEQKNSKRIVQLEEKVQAVESEKADLYEAREVLKLRVEALEEQHDSDAQKIKELQLELINAKQLQRKEIETNSKHIYNNDGKSTKEEMYNKEDDTNGKTNDHSIYNHGDNDADSNNDHTGFSDATSSHDIVSDAINGFIQDLSRTPSVRDNLKCFEGQGANKNTSLMKETIELTPPLSDEEISDSEEHDSVRHNPGSRIIREPRKSSRELYSENLSSSSIITTHCLPGDVEPFPKVEDSSSSSSSRLTQSDVAMSNVSSTAMHSSNSGLTGSKLSLIKLSPQDKQRVLTMVIAMSAMLIGFYLQRLVN